MGKSNCKSIPAVSALAAGKANASYEPSLFPSVVGVSALGQQQTCAVHQPMSALPPIADMCGALVHVCFGPIADILERQPPSLEPVIVDPDQFDLARAGLVAGGMMLVPRLAAFIALIGSVLLFLSVLFGSAQWHVPNLDDWTMYAAEFCFVLAVILFYGWFFAGCVKEIRDIR